MCVLVHIRVRLRDSQVLMFGTKLNSMLKKTNLDHQDNADLLLMLVFKEICEAKFI